MKNTAKLILLFMVISLLGVCGRTSVLAAECSNIFDSHSPVPAGFGAAYNPLGDKHEPLVSVDRCDADNIYLKIGSGGDDQYIYKKAYLFENGSLQQIELNGGESWRGDWLRSIAEAPVEVTEMTGDAFVIGYVCQYVFGEWKCGCRDRACNEPLWQLQKVRLMANETDFVDRIEAKIEDRMTTAGMHTFSSQTGKEVHWSVDRLTSDEGSGDEFVRSAGVFTADGVSATFHLEKIPQKETIYEIAVSGRGVSDTFLVRVFPARQMSVYTHKSEGNPDVPVFVIVPDTLGPDTRLITIMHDSGRSGSGNLGNWARWLVENDYIGIAPVFSFAEWPHPGYDEGNMLTDIDRGGFLNPKSEWSFTIANDIAVNALEEFALNDKRYDMFGHSGGGRFTHRFMMFMSEAPIRFAFPANPGLWLLPSLEKEYPWGLKHPRLALTEQDLLNWTNRKMIILRGMSDLQRDWGVDSTPQADAQGPNRATRAKFAYDLAKAINPDLAWERIDVPNCPHSDVCTGNAARKYLEEHSADTSETLLGQGDDARSNGIPQTFFSSRDAEPLYTVDDSAGYYLGRPIPNSDGKTFEALGGQYARDAKRIYFMGMECDADIDIESFTVLGEKYGKDREAVFDVCDVIPHADPATFTVFDADHSADSERVYYRGRPIPKADPESFVSYGVYAKDKGHLYHSGQSLTSSSADRLESWRNSEWAKDDSMVYYAGEAIEGADVASFTGFDDSDYAKDDDEVYLAGKPYPFADADSFRVLDDGFARDADHLFPPLIDTFAVNPLADVDPDTLTFDLENNVRGIHREFFRYLADTDSVYYEFTKLENADRATFEILDGEYAKDESRVYFRDRILSGADAGSFRVLEQSDICETPYAKDRNSAWIGGRKIEGSDGESFAVLSCRYAKDENNVYSFGEILTDRDAASFDVLGDGFQKGWHIKDKNGVYYWNMPIPGADPDTARQLGTGMHVIDNDQVYFLGTPILNADPASFEVFPLEMVQEFPFDAFLYSRDADHVYRGNQIFDGADPDSFRVLSENFTKDAHSVWYIGAKVVGVDAGSFEMLSPAYAKDRNRVYIFGDVAAFAEEGFGIVSTGTWLDMSAGSSSGIMAVLPDADPQTFEAVDWYYAKDARSGFFWGKRIPGSDGKTFRFNKRSRLAEDKNRWHFENKSILKDVNQLINTP